MYICQLIPEGFFLNEEKSFNTLPINKKLKFSIKNLFKIVKKNNNNNKNK